VKLPYARGSYSRQVAKTPVVPFHNRYPEEIPTLTDGPVSAIARPALKYFLNEGDGPVRKVFSAPGIFDDAAFTVHGLDLMRVGAADGSVTNVGTIGTSILGDVSMAVVAHIEDTIPSRLFIADGGVLWMYTENSGALGHLQATGAIANGYVVEINGVYYHWTNASVDASAPAGTVGNPWRVALGASNSEALRNLYWAINADEGVAGTDYSTAATPHPNVRATVHTTADLYVAANVAGTAGNAYTTTETGANTAWGAATLEDGGTTQIRQITLPGDVGAISVASINSYVIVIPVQSEDLFTVGKFYWIEPGDDFIDPLNFATAERSSDVNHQVLVYSDQFWLFGKETTEAWIMTTDPDAPVQRYQGVLYDRGSWEGTAVKLRDSMIVVDEEGVVFQLRGGPREISRPDISERIRRAMQAEGLSPLV